MLSLQYLASSAKRRGRKQNIGRVQSLPARQLKLFDQSESMMAAAGQPERRVPRGGHDSERGFNIISELSQAELSRHTINVLNVVKTKIGNQFNPIYFSQCSADVWCNFIFLNRLTRGWVAYL